MNSSKKQEASDKVKQLILSSARSYVIDYNLSEPLSLPISVLCGFIDCPIIDPYTDEEIKGYVVVDYDNNYNIVTELQKVNLDVTLGNGATTTQTFNNEYNIWDEIELVEPEKEGSEFSHWEVVKGDSRINGNKLTIGSTDTEIKAMWIKYPTFTINYDGGNISNPDVKTSYKTGTTIKLISPTKEGYTFKYWELTSGNGVISGNNFTMGDEDTVITAVWTDKVALTVNVGEGDANATYDAKYKPGIEVPLTVPTWEDHKFLGWIVSGEGASVNGNILTMGTSATTVTAEWIEVVTLTVKADAGLTVMAESGDLSYTVVVNDEGKAIIENLEAGTWKLCVTNGTETSDVETVEILEDKEIELSLFEAYIKVTYPKGSLTVSNGTDTYTHSGGGTTTITVKKKGTWTVTASYGSTIKKTQTVNVSTKGQTYTASISYTLYLFNNGSYASETGGWSNISGSEIYISYETYENNSDYAETEVTQTNNAINLTDYKTLYFEITTNHEDRAWGSQYMFAGDIILEPSYDETGTYSINVSSLNGSYFVGLKIDNMYSQDGTLALREIGATRVWLEV